MNWMNWLKMGISQNTIISLPDCEKVYLDIQDVHVLNNVKISPKRTTLPMPFPDGHFPLLHYLSFLLSHSITAKPLNQDHSLVLLSTLSLMNISFPKLASRFSSDSCAACLPKKFPNPSPFPPYLSKELT